ncbi:MAG: hypothetical protein AAGA54_14330 [Myxococcota bacterium]
MTTSIEDQLAALVDAERGRPDADAVAADRVWGGVQARLDGAAAPASVPASSSWGVLSIVGGIAVALALVGVGTVALAGADAEHAFEPVQPDPPLLVASSEPAVPHLRAELPSLAAPAPEAPAAAAPKRPTENQGSVADELALIESARADLDRGKSSLALKTLSKHRRQFPKGAFREEALALRASALCTSGKTEAAQKAASTFLKRYPSSVHTGRVRACSGASG